MPLVDRYPLLAGHHLPTNALRNLATQAGRVHPHSGAPLSEALALGISGGVGCGYILWQFKGHIGTVLTTGFTYRWNYAKEVATQLSERLGLELRWCETGGASKAAKDLNAALDAGRPAAAWLDQVHLGYLRQPRHLEGCFGWHAVVCGREGEDWLVHDLGAHARRVPDAMLAASRKRIGSYKHRLAVVDGLSKPDWPGAVRAGVADCARYLSDKSDSFSIPAINKWARMVTDPKHKKGWVQAFPGGIGLASALLSTYENVAHGMSDGTGLRATYAQFCREGAVLAGWPALETAAPAWEASAGAWRAVAQAAMPEDGPHAGLKSQLDRRRALLLQPPTAASEQELDAVSLALSQSLHQANSAPVQSAAERAEQLEALRAALLAVVDAERTAVAALSNL